MHKYMYMHSEPKSYPICYGMYMCVYMYMYLLNPENSHDIMHHIYYMYMYMYMYFLYLVTCT